MEDSIKSNAVFKRVMRNEGLCKRLLSILLGREVTDLKYLETEHQALGDAESKEMRLDCFSITADGEIFDVEMQVGNEKDLGKRMRAYQSIIDRDALAKDWDGETMEFGRMPSTYIIFICVEHPFSWLTKKRICKREFSVTCDNEPNLVPDTGAKWFVYDASMYEEAEDPQVREFLEYVSKSKFRPENDFLSDLDAEVKRFVNGDEWRMLLDSRVEARTEGYIKGKAEGEAAGKAEGEARLAKLVGILAEQERFEDIKVAANDPERREELMRKYGIE